VLARSYIFLSHSANDVELRDKFIRARGLAGIKVEAFEFDIQSGRVTLDQGGAAPTIRAWVAAAQAVFVVIGPNVIATPYTSNWVAFEIGLAYSSGVPTWVFEDERQPVDFPVPGLDHWVLFNPNWDEHWDFIRDIMEGYLPRFLRPRDPFASPDLYVQCIHSNCRNTYYLHCREDLRSAKCPSCRQPTQW
jgi:hypothetical protein